MSPDATVHRHQKGGSRGHGSLQAGGAHIVPVPQAMRHERNDGPSHLPEPAREKGRACHPVHVVITMHEDGLPHRQGCQDPLHSPREVLEDAGGVQVREGGTEEGLRRLRLMEPTGYQEGAEGPGKRKLLLQDGHQPWIGDGLGLPAGSGGWGKPLGSRRGLGPAVQEASSSPGPRRIPQASQEMRAAPRRISFWI